MDETANGGNKNIFLDKKGKLRTAFAHSETRGVKSRILLEPC